MDEQALGRLRARVLWYALRTAVLDGRGAATFKRSDLERMLELGKGEPLEPVLAYLPADSVCATVDDDRVKLTQAGSDDFIEQVLLHWKEVTARTEAVVFDKKRKGYVRRAIRDGYTPTQLCDALTTMSQSAWHRGENPSGQRYDDVSHALGSAERIDKWLAKPRDSTPDPTAPMQEAREKAAARRSKGDRRRR